MAMKTTYVCDLCGATMDTLHQVGTVKVDRLWGLGPSRSAELCNSCYEECLRMVQDFLAAPRERPR